MYTDFSSYLNAAHTIPVKSPCSGSRGWQQGPQEAIIWVRKEVNNARTIMIRWPSTVEEEGVEVNQSKRRVCVLTRELIKVTLRRMGMI